MTEESEDVPDWLQSRASFEEHTESILRELDRISEEEFQSRLDEAEENPYENLDMDEDICKADVEEFFGGILGYMKQKREIQSGLKDVTEFDDDEWEDGFEFLNEITVDDDVMPTCLECDEILDPEFDDIRVAADGGVIYTQCSNCGEATIEDNRASNTMIEDSIPDMGDVEVKMSDDFKDEFVDENN